MPYHPKLIANFFIRKGISEGDPLDPMRVIKMTYIAHGWYLAHNDRPLINELVEAWKYGPVIYSLYHKLKHYFNNPVTQEMKVDILSCEAFWQDLETQRFLYSVWDKYKKYSGTQLSILTHNHNSPWRESVKPCIEKGHLTSNPIIKNDLIKKHYQEKLKAASQKSEDTRTGKSSKA